MWAKLSGVYLCVCTRAVTIRGDDVAAAAARRRLATMFFALLRRGNDKL